MPRILWLPPLILNDFFLGLRPSNHGKNSFYNISLWEQLGLDSHAFLSLGSPFGSPVAHPQGTSSTEKRKKHFLRPFIFKYVMTLSLNLVDNLTEYKILSLT